MVNVTMKSLEEFTMTTVQIKLSDQLAQEAQRAGLLSEAAIEKLLRAALRSVKHAEFTRLHFNANSVLKMEQTYSFRGDNTWVAFYVNAIDKDII